VDQSIAKPSDFQLLLHVSDVVVGPRGGRELVLYRGVSAADERIPAHRLQHVVAAHLVPARQHVAYRVVCAHAPCATCRKDRGHGQAVVLWACPEALRRGTPALNPSVVVPAFRRMTVDNYGCMISRVEVRFLECGIIAASSFPRSMPYQFHPGSSANCHQFPAMKTGSFVEPAVGWVRRLCYRMAVSKKFFHIFPGDIVMSCKHPVIAVTGSSGAGNHHGQNWPLKNIFRREGIKAGVVEGDSLHSLDRMAFRAAAAEAAKAGNNSFSHFGPGSNHFRQNRGNVQEVRRNRHVQAPLLRA